MIKHLHSCSYHFFKGNTICKVATPPRRTQSKRPFSRCHFGGQNKLFTGWGYRMRLLSSFFFGKLPCLHHVNQFQQPRHGRNFARTSLNFQQLIIQRHTLCYRMPMSFSRLAPAKKHLCYKCYVSSSKTSIVILCYSLSFFLSPVRVNIN